MQNKNSKPPVSPDPDDLLDLFDDDPEYDEDYIACCHRCGGNQWIVTCPDDLCRNSGYCMHGDGEHPCPNCNDDCEDNRCYF